MPNWELKRSRGWDSRKEYVEASSFRLDGRKTLMRFIGIETKTDQIMDQTVAVKMME